MKAFKIFFILSAIMCVSACAHAKEAGWKEDSYIFKDKKRGDFTVRVLTKGCELSLSAQVKIEKGLYFIYTFFNDRLSPKYDMYSEARIRFFGDFGEFKEYQKKFSDGASDTGFFSNKLDEIVVLSKEDESWTVGMAYHEATHFFVRHHFYRLPMWVAEGLAEYFRGLKIEGNNAIVLYDLRSEAWIMYWRERREFIDLKQYIDMPYEDWLEYNKRMPSAGYMTSWSLVYFFMSSEQRQNIFRDILRYLAAHQTLEQVSLPFNNYYPGGIEQLEKDWFDWIQQRNHFYNLE